MIVNQQQYEAAQAFLKLCTVAMPANTVGIRNGTLIRATEAIGDAGLCIGVSEGATFPVLWDGTYVRGGGLVGPSWSVKQMQDEFARGWWNIVGNLDEATLA